MDTKKQTWKKHINWIYMKWIEMQSSLLSHVHLYHNMQMCLLGELIHFTKTGDKR